MMIKMMNDTKWDIRFMRLAREISRWSKDPSTKLGSIIVNSERKIVATGYNGFPKGIDDTFERLSNRDEKYPRIVHAEANALMNALYNGVSVKNCTIYIYGLPPCPDCTKLIIQSGISRIIITPDPYKAATHWSDKWDKISKLMIEETKLISFAYMNMDTLDNVI